MRHDAEVLRRIVAFAEARPDIQYLIQNGSRVNPSITADAYSDYDIIAGCASWREYADDESWINEFGDLLILQRNDIEEDGIRWPIFLMQFSDGLRIDMQFFPGDGQAIYRRDSLSKVIYDRDGAFIDRFEPSEAMYIMGKPTEHEYVAAVNEFWWCVINVGKGIARKELTYSRFMYDSIVREAFLSVVSWHVASLNGWSINPGKFGKFLERHAEPELWSAIKRTYPGDTDESFWDSVIEACRLVAMMDGRLRASLGIKAPPEDADGIIAFLERIRRGEFEPA